MVNGEGRRLAKRDGDVTLRDVSAGEAQRWILDSLRAGGGAGGEDAVAEGLMGMDLSDVDRIADLPEVFDLMAIPREQVVFR